MPSGNPGRRERGNSRRNHSHDERRDESREERADGRKAAAFGMGLVSATLLASALYAGHRYSQHQNHRTEQENAYGRSSGSDQSRSYQRYMEDERESYLDDQNSEYSRGYEMCQGYPRPQGEELPLTSRRPTGASSRSARSRSSTAHQNHADEFEIEESEESELGEISASANDSLPSSQAVVPFTEAPQSQVATPAIRRDTVESSVPLAPSIWQRDPMSGGYFYDNQGKTLRTWSDGATAQMRPPAPELPPEWIWDERYEDHYFYDPKRQGWQYYKGQFVLKTDQ